MRQGIRDRLRERSTWIAIGVVVIAASTLTVALVRDRSSYLEGTSTLSVISGDVQVAPPGGALRTADGEEALVAGAIVRTGQLDGRTVLTFRDGSTVELEPGTTVAIKELALGSRGELMVVVEQESGTTWSHVQPLLSPNSRFHIKTPSATAVVRGTSFEVVVDGADGASVTKVSVFAGRVDLVARGKVEPVSAGHSAEVTAGAAPSAVRPLELDGSCVRFQIHPEALMTVTDPHGRSAGLTRSGAISQIPRVVVSGPQTDPQSVDVFAPAAGEWEIGLVPRGDGGPVQLLLTTVSGGEIADQQALVLSVGLGDRIVTRVRLDAPDVSGSFDPPARSTATRVVAVPKDATTSMPLPGARLYTVQELEGLAPSESLVRTMGCLVPEKLDPPNGVEVLPSPEQTSGR